MASFLLSSPFTRSFPHFSFLDNLHCSPKRISWHQTSLLELHRLFMEWSDGFLPLPLAFSHTHKHTLAYWTIELGPNPAEILITSLPSPRRAKTTRINMWPVFFLFCSVQAPCTTGGCRSQRYHAICSLMAPPDWPIRAWQNQLFANGGRHPCHAASAVY